MDEALRMGAHPDDRDGVTDMTLLMYVYLYIYIFRHIIVVLLIRRKPLANSRP